MPDNVIQLPEPSRRALLDLYQKQEAAKLLYTVALNSTVIALGVDPAGNHTVNLDNGKITSPAPAGPALVKAEGG